MATLRGLGWSIVAGAVVTMCAATWASAQVPTAKDFQACNMRAAEKVADAPSASPSMDPKASKAPTGKSGTPSDDSQMQGIDKRRLNDAMYVSEYRSCMRQLGF